MRIQVEVKTNNVKIYVDGQVEPVIDQPFDPSTGQAFNSEAAAARWAEELVAGWDTATPAIEPVAAETAPVA